MPAAIVCFESFRSERERRRARDLADVTAVGASPFPHRLANVILNARQIAHRRAMLDFGRQRLAGTRSVTDSE
jgi:hypothetical protein